MLKFQESKMIACTHAFTSAPTVYPILIWQDKIFQKAKTSKKKKGKVDSSNQIWKWQRRWRKMNLNKQKGKLTIDLIYILNSQQAWKLVGSETLAVRVMVEIRQKDCWEVCPEWVSPLDTFSHSAQPGTPPLPGRGLLLFSRTHEMESLWTGRAQLRVAVLL